MTTHLSYKKRIHFEPTVKCLIICRFCGRFEVSGLETIAITRFQKPRVREDIISTGNGWMVKNYEGDKKVGFPVE